jgi:AcrR family transcriptional regulator
MSLRDVDLPGQRGPAQHEMRDKILRAAEARFHHYGYEKTTIGDIAKDLKVSTAYIYKFFDSKLAINEAVALDVLARIGAEIWKAARRDGPAGDRLRAVYHALLDESLRMFFDNRKLHDMVLTALENDWCAVARHKETIGEVVRHLIREGRASGEFETVSLEERTVAAVTSTMTAFANPHVLQQTIDNDLKRQADAVADVVLRGLQA